MSLLPIQQLRQQYVNGRLTPTALVAEIKSRIQHCDDSAIWIHVLNDTDLQPYLQRLQGIDPKNLPLYGIPFAVKDNIDLAGIPTTAACPEYAYRPERSAYVVSQLIAAGAIPIGKTNLDQFATGLVGTRSPYGEVRNVYDSAYISGGSSSGSAAAVARGHVSFALGTDTAGSGRVPAAFNNLVGIKPSRGLLSTDGVVPACRSLDCVSIFSTDFTDASIVFDVAAHYNRDDPWARRLTNTSFNQQSRIGIPPSSQLEFFGNALAEKAFHAAVDHVKASGFDCIEQDCSAFFDAAKLLYGGPWVAERYAAIEDFIQTSADAIHPVVRDIIAPAANMKAVDVFKAQYELQALACQADAVWQHVDAILTPTAGTIYTIKQVLDDPVQLNSNLGYYTNFMNLLDCCAVAAPAGFMENGIPFGVTLFAPAFRDRALMALGTQLAQ